MKIVHLVTEDVGGAARAARRISQALKELGYDSVVLTMERYDASSQDTVQVFRNKGEKLIFKVNRKLHYLLQREKFHRGRFGDAQFGMDLLKHPLIKSADIINLHWIGFGFLSYKGMENLFLNKKVVWTLHDMWAITAGCYYDENCGQYITGCHDCKFISGINVKSYTEKCAKLKEKVYAEPLQLTFVGCSNWIASCARQSWLTSKFDSYAIPNPIDIVTFAPKNNIEEVKQKYGIGDEQKVILFGAMNSDQDKRKGYDLLKDALKRISVSQDNRDNIVLIVFGNENAINNLYGFKTIGLGIIKDNKTLAEVYSMADVFVAPSRQENLSNSVMESLACGTPTVAFNIGGMSDLIEHKQNGFLADAFNIDQFKEGICFCIEHNDELKLHARESVLKKYTMREVGKQYENLYQKILDK